VSGSTIGVNDLRKLESSSLTSVVSNNQKITAAMIGSNGAKLKMQLKNEVKCEIALKFKLISIVGQI